MEEIYPGRDHTGRIGKKTRRWSEVHTDKVVVPEITAPSGNPDTDTGWLYAKVDGTTTKLYFEDQAGTVTDLIAAATGNTLDTAYDQGGAGSGKAITVDSGAVALTNNAANNNGVLTIEKTPTGAQSGDLVTLTMGAQATGDALQFANSGSGNDIAGSGATWSVSQAGVATFASISGLTSGITVTGGTINLNASSNNAVNVATGTSTGAVAIGSGLSTVAINSSSWDISSAGAVSGVTSIAASDDITLANGKAVKSSTTTAETVKFQAYDVDNTTYRDCITLTNGDTVAITIGSNNETVAINSADWDIGATGDMTGIGAITMDGLLTASLGATVTGGVVNLNASSNNAVNIGTGTTTSTVTIGGAGAQTINVGDGAAAKTVTLGSSNTTSTTTISAGSGKINLVGALATGDAVTGDGTAALGGFMKTVLNDTDAHTVLVTESGTILTNAGAAGPFAHTLPAAAVGLEFTFIVMAAQELRVTPAAGDVINIAGVPADAAEYWTANGIGESLTLVAVDTTNWIATSMLGTWTQAA